jgi:predicted alpha/beta-hydrolase family hydrolase
MALSTDNLLHAAELARRVYDLKPDWLVERHRDQVYLAIEGSDEAADWRRNFEFVYTAGDTHAGFANYATLLMAQMLTEGVSFRRDDHLIISGHSLGGAVATIIAAHLQDHLPWVDLVTFGSPRPGGRRFRQRLRVPHHRYVHGDDVVPHLPSAAFGFRHTAPARVLWIDDDSPLRGVADHAMDGYLHALEQSLA